MSVEAKFNAVIDSFGKFLRHSILRFCPKDLGLQYDDIEQEARLKLWRALESEREIANTASYLYKIAATVTIDAIRQAKSRKEEQMRVLESDDELYVEIPATDPSPEDLAENRELIRKVRNCLKQLPENRRLAVGLYMQGMTNEEIGEISGWSEAKARNLTYRGLKDLRKRLAEEGIEYDGGITRR